MSFRAIPRRLVPLVVAGSIAGAAACFAGGGPEVEERIFGGHRALVVVTHGAPKEARLPMIVALHWSGAWPEEMVEDFADLPVDARVVFPQAHYPRRNGWSWFPAGYYDAEPEVARAETLRAVDELAEWIELARRELPTDGRPIATGISYGGDLAYLLAVRHPDSVRAAFPIAARFLPEWIPAPRPCTERCPWVVAFHGEDDWVVGLAAARAAAARLRAEGYPVTLQSYPGAGHEFAAAMRRDFERELELRLGGASAFERVDNGGGGAR